MLCRDGLPAATGRRTVRPASPEGVEVRTGYPNYLWRQTRSYALMVLRVGTLWLTWYSGQDGGGKTIGVAYASAEVPAPEEEEFVPEAGSLLLLAGGLLTLAGYAGVRYRKR